MTQTALILGANGRFGRAAAHAFLDAGWQVTAATRDGTSRIAHPDLRTAKLDITAPGALERLATGADVIVHAVNPRYDRWRVEAMPALRATIAAARKAGATILLPGNVYVFGRDMPEVLGPATPHRATNPLGLIRREMEQALRDSGVPTIVLRAGDFLEAGASGNWFDMIMTKKLAQDVLTYPGPTDRAHAWAYLPDVGRAAVALAERRGTLPRFADVPFPGLTLTGRQMAEAISRVTGRPLRTRGFPWTAIRLMGVGSRFWRHLAEMRYLWVRPHRLDPAPMAALLPEFRATPRDEVFRAIIDPALQGQAMSTQTSRWFEDTTPPAPTSA